MSGSQEDELPLLRVIAGGEPNSEEVAALVAAFAAVTARAETRAEPVSSSRWASRERGLRRPLHPGRGAWRASAHPD